MTRYLISFDDGAMTFPEEDLPDVAEAAHKVVQEAKDAGVWIFGGGLQSQRASIVATDGTVTDGPYPETKAVIGGFSIIDVPSREEALEWAAKIAVACRCAQEVREILPDPDLIEGDPPDDSVVRLDRCPDGASVRAGAAGSLVDRSGPGRRPLDSGPCTSRPTRIMQRPWIHRRGRWRCRAGRVPSVRCAPGTPEPGTA